MRFASQNRPPNERHPELLDFSSSLATSPLYPKLSEIFGYNPNMETERPRLLVPRQRLPEEQKKKRRSATWDDGVDARLNKLAARTGLNLTQIVEACILKTLPAFEADPGEILRDEKP
jgi:hypothetical protein